MELAILGFLANLTSMILWIPQAATTWKNRKNPYVLQGINIWTQVITACNTIFWCMYGMINKDLWLMLGTIIILPLALMTIYLKLRASKEIRKIKDK